MQDFLNWTIDTIRSDRLIGSWLEERKYEWTPLVAKSMKYLLEQNRSVIIITDNQREWFLEYIMAHINSFNRPYLPFYDYRAICRQLDNARTEDDLELIKDMLSISFTNGYFIWYIGNGNHKRALLPKTLNSSFMWNIDDEAQDVFNLKSNDEALDIKLLQMFRLYNKTITASLFAEINVDE
jgi:hypothetical protein